MKLGATQHQACLELHLHADQPLRLENARGLTLRCVSGCVWITLAGEAEDIFLHPGQEYVIRSRRLLLIEGIGEGRVSVLRQVRPRWFGLGRPAASRVPTLIPCRRVLCA